MFESAGSGAPAALSLLGPAQTVLERCEHLTTRSGTTARLELVRALDDLALVAQVAAARVLGGLDVHDSAQFTPEAFSDPGPGAVTPHEIAGCLQVSIESVRMRLTVAGSLVGDLPEVLAAAEHGQLRWWQVRRTVDAAWALPREVLSGLDTEVARLAAEGRVQSRFAATLDRVVLALAPDRAERDLKQELTDRAVRVRPDRDVPGLGVLVATMPAEGAITVAACLDRLADSPLSQPPVGLPTDGRSADARRSDALVGLSTAVLAAFETVDSAAIPMDRASAATSAAADDPAVLAAVTAAIGLALGLEPAASTDGRRVGPDGQTSSATHRGAPAGRPVRRRTGPRRSDRVLVTVSAETLLGVSDHPAQLAGWGPITARHARRLAGREGTTWQRLLTDPVSGSVLDVGRTFYPATAAITDHVLTRDDGRCTRPGCGHAARDLDHATAWADGGDTAVANLHAVCRGCHSARHGHPGGAGHQAEQSGTGGTADPIRPWSVSIAPDGAVTWVTPRGHGSTRPVADRRPEDRMAPAARVPVARVPAAPIPTPVSANQQPATGLSAAGTSCRSCGSPGLPTFDPAGTSSRSRGHDLDDTADRVGQWSRTVMAELRRATARNSSAGLDDHGDAGPGEDRPPRTRSQVTGSDPPDTAPF